MSAKVFYDTNILVYLLAGDAAKADKAEQLLAQRGMISVQVLNEFASVAKRKLGLSWAEIAEILGQIRVICPVAHLTPETHERALQLAERYQLSIYDANIIAAALIGKCKTLYSEDMQHGQVIEQQLTICNPFAPMPKLG